jgi:hypothetical protein
LTEIVEVLRQQRLEEIGLRGLGVDELKSGTRTHDEMAGQRKGKLSTQGLALETGIAFEIAVMCYRNQMALPNDVRRVFVGFVPVRPGHLKGTEIQEIGKWFERREGRRRRWLGVGRIRREEGEGWGGLPVETAQDRVTERMFGVGMLFFKVLRRRERRRRSWGTRQQMIQMLTEDKPNSVVNSLEDDDG